MLNAETPTASSVHPATALTGESPVWDAPRGILWWVDIQGQRLLGFSPSSGRRVEFPVPSMPGLVALSNRSDLILGLEDGLWRFNPDTGSATHLWKLEDDPRVRLNDGKPDVDGRLWFGSMDKTNSGARIGALFCRHRDGRVDRVLDDVGVANGIAVSPDGKFLYFADSLFGRVTRFSLDRETGALSHAVLLAEYPDGLSPDGSAVDDEGALWIAVVGIGAIDRILPNGVRDRRVLVPVSRPTMLAFGGPDLKTVFVTSQRRNLSFDGLSSEPLAGHLLALEIGATGAPVNVTHLGE